MKIIIDTHLRIDESEIKEEWKKGLVDFCSVPNEAKQVAIREHIRGAKHMPDKIKLGGFEDGYFVAPRGLCTEILERLKKVGVEVEVEDNRVSNQLEEIIPKVTLREDQSRAVNYSILPHEQGIANMSTGFGKTVVGLCAAAKSKEKTIILVNKISLATQWIDRCKEHIGVEMGLIGDNEWDHNKQFTVATLQSLYSKRKELDDDDWWSQFGFVIHDESHHISGETYYDIVNRFPARFRIGLSATLGKSPAKSKISKMTFGPVIYESLQLKFKPIVNKVHTDFEFQFEGTSFINGKRVQNNYSKLLKALIQDEERNRLVAKNVASDPKAAHLVVSRRLAHLGDIKDLTIEYGFPADRCFMLTGKETLEERENVAQEAAHGAIAIFSTIADEGLDIPRLDRIHLPFPSKDPEAIKQQVGRGLRQHPNKTDCIVYDYVDSKCSVLKNQFRKRLTGYYVKNKIEIQ